VTTAEEDELRADLAALRAEVARLRAMAPRDELRAILENAPDVIALMDGRGRVLYANRFAGGRTLQDVVGRNALEFMPEEHHKTWRSALARVLETGESQVIELVSLSGLCLQTRLVRLPQHQGDYHVMGISSDVTDQRRAERALHESDEKLRLAISAASMGVWRWDRASDEATFDAGAMALFARSNDDAPRTFAQHLELVHPVDRERVAASLKRSIATAHYEDIEYRVPLRDGSVRWILAKGAVMRDDAGEVCALHGVMLDITRRKELEAQLRQAQKMEAVGQLTAGVAHNFNNMLMGILPNLELSLKRAPESLKPKLLDAHAAAGRTREMIQQLMLFSRGTGGGKTARVDLHGVVTSIVSMCAVTFDRQIELCLVPPPSMHVVEGDDTQLGQAILNLLLNARDALELAERTTRSIVVEIEHADERSAFVRDLPAQQHGYHCIVVSDDGVGMDDTTLSRIFEPFFTTKEVGRGTGLGLSSTYAIVTEHGGRIRCQSEVGRGTRFEVYLPAREPIAKTSVPNTPSPGIEQGSELILVIDDEPLVRTTLARLLEIGGYSTILAADGPEGIETYRKERDRIGLVLLDMSMPKMSGEATLRELVAISEDVRVILLSGYAVDLAKHPRARAFLPKPSSLDEMLRMVREVLDR